MCRIELCIGMNQVAFVAFGSFLCKCLPIHPNIYIYTHVFVDNNSNNNNTNNNNNHNNNKDLYNMI